ncbi:MAG: glycerol-3-phosphate dehydrogenase [Legionella sp.]|nr:MAG: glycerol-3-phosphate dehydrogenase [Legionella sp.]
MLYDVVVIGGGINGCGCAADAALRGLSVLVCEQDDLASKTSSKSSKLIHGGLRYLEQYNFNLVKKSLDEQAVLMRIAPHLVHPLPFVLPHRKTLRPAWLLQAGLFLYDRLSRINPLPNSKKINKEKHPDYFMPLSDDNERGFLFYDCHTDDARLTLSVALQAKEHGATILSHTKFIAAYAQKDHWVLTLQPKIGKSFQISTKSIVNAAGPWAHQVAECLRLPVKQPMTYVKGSHIVVPALYPGQHAYLLQAPDKRIVFVIPYHGHSLVGTTDVLLTKYTDFPSIDAEEIAYLRQIIRTYFQQEPSEILATWSGVRALCASSDKKASQLTRDYTLEYSSLPLPVVSILGGKLTTYRHVASEAIDHLKKHQFPQWPTSCTKTAPLPGSLWEGHRSLIEYKHYAIRHYAWLDTAVLEHYLTHYGTRTELILKNCTHTDDLGRAFGPILYQKEVDYLRQEEWASSAEDILWRRTKLGLSIRDEAQAALEAYLVFCESEPHTRLL